MKILDCTLRDGGYYNGWGWTMSEARALVEAVAAAGVDIVELGYRSLGEGRGVFRYCREELLGMILKPPGIEFAVMCDVGEFEDARALEAVFPRGAAESSVDWVRLASHHREIERVPDMVRCLHGLGFKVTFNLMQGSTLTRDQIVESIRMANECEVDVYYFADSFGSMQPALIGVLAEDIVNFTECPIGFHGHDNRGLALANAMAVVGCGVEYIDSAVMGMGRGAGNVATEQLLQFMARDYEKLAPVIDDVLEPLKCEHGWGPSLPYMVAAELGVHPGYVLELVGIGGLSTERICEALRLIPEEMRHRFDLDGLYVALSMTDEISKNICGKMTGKTA